MSKSEALYLHIPESEIEKATKYCAEQEQSVSYFEFVYLAEFKISYNNLNKIIVSNITAGD